LSIDFDALGHVLLDEEGQWLVLETTQDLGIGDTNGSSDVYRIDLTTEDLVLLSRTPYGDAGNGPSSYPATDRMGEWVVFQSDADDLVADDRNGVTDIFIHEVWTGGTARITGDSVGASGHPVLDGTGVELLYDQVGDGGRRQILADTVWSSEMAQPISLDRDEMGLALDNHHPAMSTDGRFVAYLEERGPSEERICHVHLFDRDTGNYQRQACPEDLAVAAEDARPSFSPDGTQVEWYIPGADSMVVMPNTLVEADAG
jgi:Tol biopolymer transport system component